MQTVPRQRARPPGRRQQIARVAARLFRDKGYDTVRMADIAAAVGVTTPALYRHYPTKQALLDEAIQTALDQVDDAFAAPGGPAPEVLRRTLTAFARLALVRRDVWTLLQRELRHLPDDRRAAVIARYGRIAGRLAESIAATRPGLAADDAALISHAVLAAFGSVSQYRPAVRRGRAEQMLGAAAGALAAAALAAPPLDDGGDATRSRPSALAGLGSRREELLAAATRLFRQRGYLAVTTEEIGAAAAMTGPSVYHYFSSKADLLNAAVSRAAEWLSLGRAQAAVRDDPPGQALGRLVRHYIDIGLSSSDLLGVYLTEREHLPRPQAQRMASAFLDNVAGYRALLIAARGDVSGPEADVLIFAALGVVNDLVRRGGLRERPQLAEDLTCLSATVLFAPLPR
jgi:AcrR family transcriptional regulator